MTTEPTDAELEKLFVEETGVAIDDLPAAILDFARAVLAKWGTPAPVGVEPALHQYQASDGTWKDFDSERHRRDTVAAGYPVRTLYTVTHVQAGAVPMTPEQVVDAFCKQPHTVQFVEAFINGVRFAERHHGIKGSQHER